MIGRNLSSLPSEIHQRAATYTVAASNSRAPVQADYFCDGVADNVQIQAAIDACPDGGSVELLEGTYNLSSGLVFNDRRFLTFRGLGRVTLNHTGSDRIIYLDGQVGARCSFNTFENFYIVPGATTLGVLYVKSGCDSNHFRNMRVVGAATIRLNPSSVFQDDGGVFTDYTTAATDDTDNDVVLLPAVPVANDAFYIRYTAPFRSVFSRITTAGVGTWTIVWEYWNGNAWTAHTDLVDETSPWNTTTGVRTQTSFTVVGASHISWTLPGDWAQTTVNGVSGYWTRARVGAFTAITTQPLGARIALATSAPTIGIHLHSHDIAATPDRGNFTNHFENIDIAQIPVGIFIETSGDPSRLNNNANLFTNVVATVMHTELKINGGQGNTFIGHDFEGSYVSLDLNEFIDTTFLGGWISADVTGALTNISRGRAWTFGGQGPSLPQNNQIFTQFGRAVELPNLSLSASSIPSGANFRNIGFTTTNERGLWYGFNSAYPVWPVTNHMVGREMHLGTNGWTNNAIGGSGSATILPHALDIQTGAAGDGGRRLSALAALLVGRNNNVGTLARVDWGKPLFLRFTMMWIGSNQAAIGRIQLKNADAEGILAENGIGLQITYNGTVLVLTGESYGAARSTQLLTQDISIPPGNGVEVGIVHRPANYPVGWITPQVDFYLHGNLAGSITTAANIPSAVESSDDYFNISFINNGTADSSNLIISDMFVWQGEQASG